MSKRKVLIQAQLKGKFFTLRWRGFAGCGKLKLKVKTTGGRTSKKEEHKTISKTALQKFTRLITIRVMVQT